MTTEKHRPASGSVVYHAALTASIGLRGGKPLYPVRGTQLPSVLKCRALENDTSTKKHSLLTPTVVSQAVAVALRWPHHFDLHPSGAVPRPSVVVIEVGVTRSAHATEHHTPVTSRIV